MLANGCIQMPGDVARCMRVTGAAGVMSAEGLLSNPLLFEERLRPGYESALEYLELAARFKANTASVRAHVFRMCHYRWVLVWLPCSGFRTMRSKHTLWSTNNSKIGGRSHRIRKFVTSVTHLRGKIWVVLESDHLFVNFPWVKSESRLLSAFEMAAQLVSDQNKFTETLFPLPISQPPTCSFLKYTDLRERNSYVLGVDEFRDVVLDIQRRCEAENQIQSFEELHLDPTLDFCAMVSEEVDENRKLSCATSGKDSGRQ